MSLSVRRAKTVREYLVTVGVANALLISRGFGERFPKQAPTGNLATALTLNRRVEFKVIN